MRDPTKKELHCSVVIKCCRCHVAVDGIIMHLQALQVSSLPDEAPGDHVGDGTDQKLELVTVVPMVTKGTVTV